ncbi:MAG: hypothetical protein KC684_03840 [Candidatus Omnitrophica bacterium]|nr:hypothetical protein [Candidatus Omnitrophota bacterium]
MKYLKNIVLILIIVGGIYYQWSHSIWVRDNPDGALRSQPVQSESALPSSFTHKDYTIIPKAYFNIKARVLSRKRYFLGRETDLVPVDLALGWGVMSDFKVLKELKISQSNRWYFYRYSEPPILKSEIASHSANMHLIPADKEVAKAIQSVRKGEIVSFKGYLVNVSAKDGWHWNSSLSRTDTGAHACELVWVKEFQVE